MKCECAFGNAVPAKRWPAAPAPAPSASPGGAHRANVENRSSIHLPGGNLELEWAENKHVFLTGEAVEVFQGDFET